MAKENNLTTKIRSIMEQIKKQAYKEEEKKDKLRSFSIHPDQKRHKKE